MTLSQCKYSCWVPVASGGPEKVQAWMVQQYLVCRKQMNDGGAMMCKSYSLNLDVLGLLCVMRHARLYDIMMVHNTFETMS